MDISKLIDKFNQLDNYERLERDIQRIIFGPNCAIKLRNVLEPIYVEIQNHKRYKGSLSLGNRLMPLLSNAISLGFSDNLEKLLGIENKISMDKSNSVIRKSIPKTVRDKLWISTFGKDNAKGICGCCQKDIHILEWEAGHIEAVAKGGLDTLDNLMPICGSCNRSMGTQNLYEFRRLYFNH